jgi:hypothetical protein
VPVRALTVPLGPRPGCRCISPSWPEHVRSQVKSKKARPSWIRRCSSSKGRGSAGSRRSSIGREAGCCYGKAIPKPPRSSIMYCLNLNRGRAMRSFYEVSDLLLSFAVFAVIPLLLPAVFRCYFATVGFKKPEFLPLSEVLPLYFPGIISGISERDHPRSKSACDGLRSVAAARMRCIRGCACLETRPGSAGLRLSILSWPRKARPRRTPLIRVDSPRPRPRIQWRLGASTAC